MDAQHATGRNRLLIGIAAAAAAVAAVVGVLVLAADDDERLDTAISSNGTSSVGASTTTTEAPATIGSATVDPTTAVFPDPTTSRRFDDPDSVAFAFTSEVLGFRTPVVGDFVPGDSRSGEVVVRAFATQPHPTTVLVRQLEDDTWFVIGAVTESIRLDVPEQGTTIASPQPLEGAASAFEGTVDVRLFVDGVLEPIATTFVTGGGTEELGDFTGELEFEVPDGVDHGVLILYEASAEDGSTLAATVIRVHF